MSPEPDKTVAQARFQECVRRGKLCVDAERAWAKFAESLVEIEDQKYYESIGYKSMGRCMMEIETLTECPRSTAYDYIAVYRAAAKHAPANVFDMRIGSARSFAVLPEHLQREEKIQMAASESPEKFEEHIRTQHPEALWEKPHILKLPSSRWEVIKSAIEYYREVEDDQELTDQECLEFLSADWKALRMSLEEIAKNSSELV